MKHSVNKNEIIEDIRRINSEENKSSCLSWDFFYKKLKEKTPLVLSKKTILRQFDGKWYVYSNCA